MANPILGRVGGVSEYMARQRVLPGSGVFTADVSAFIAKAQLSMDLVLRKILFDVSTRIVEMSPVGKPELWAANVDRQIRGLRPIAPKGYVGGRFRANWQFGTGSMPNGTTPDPKPNAAENIARLANQFKDAKCGIDHYLVNNLPYSIPLEYGWSTQAPQGMVRTTIAAFQNMVRNATSGP